MYLWDSKSRSCSQFGENPGEAHYSNRCCSVFARIAADHGLLMIYLALAFIASLKSLEIAVNHNKRLNACLLCNRVVAYGALSNKELDLMSIYKVVL